MSSVQAKIVKFVRQEKVKIEREKIEKIDLQDTEICTEGFLNDY